MFDTVTRYSKFLALVQAMNDELGGETAERSRVLVSFAVLEACIAETLLGFLADCSETKQLLEPTSGGALGTFSMRVRACVALGLLPRSDAQVCRDLAKIRNDFAHEVAPRLEGSLLTLLEKCESATQSDVAENLSLAGRFQMVCTHLSLHIALRWEHRKLARLELYPEPEVWKLANIDGDRR